MSILLLPCLELFPSKRSQSPTQPITLTVSFSLPAPSPSARHLTLLPTTRSSPCPCPPPPPDAATAQFVQAPKQQASHGADTTYDANLCSETESTATGVAIVVVININRWWIMDFGLVGVWLLRVSRGKTEKRKKDKPLKKPKDTLHSVSLQACHFTICPFAVTGLLQIANGSGIQCASVVFVCMILLALSSCPGPSSDSVPVWPYLVMWTNWKAQRASLLRLASGSFMTDIAIYWRT